MSNRPVLVISDDVDLEDDQVQEFIRTSEQRYQQLQDEVNQEDLDPDNLSAVLVLRGLDTSTGATRELVYRLTLPVWLLADGNALAVFINNLLNEIQLMHLDVIVAMSDGGADDAGEGGLSA